ncbi:MAG TPA: site-specific integrase [Symbiobacteriaceae bacterium]|nr:site-specific integrase [Symbiobacteriaceae bacterium]
MKGHVRQRGKAGAWYAVFDNGTVNGKRNQKWQRLDAKTKKEAEKELVKLLNAVNTNTYTEPSKVTLAEYLDKWIESKKAKGSLSRRSLERYQDVLRLYVKPYIGQVPLTKLQPLQIEECYQKAMRERMDKEPGTRSATTIRGAHVILGAALRQAVIWRMLVWNPMDGVEAPKVKKPKMTVLDEEQTMKLLAAMRGTDLYMPCLLAVAAGMRRNEILALRWADINFKTGTLHVRQALEESGETKQVTFKEPKTDHGRRPVTLPGFALDELKAWKREQAERRLEKGSEWRDLDLVCDRGDGLYHRPMHFSMKFMRFVQKLDLPRVKLHALRHGHATHLLKAGVPAKVISERLGHGRIGTTLDMYVDVLEGMQQDAALKLDAVYREAKGQNATDWKRKAK